MILSTNLNVPVLQDILELGARQVCLPSFFVDLTKVLAILVNSAKSYTVQIPV